MSDHMREQFEDMMSSQGEWPQAIEKDSRGGYKFATAATASETWQSAWEAGQEMMKSRVKELEAITLGLMKTLLEMDAEKAKLVEALETVKSVLESDDPGIVCTLGVPPNVHLSETLYDHVCSALSAHRKKGGGE